MRDEVEEGADCNCAVCDSNDDGDGSLLLESQFLSFIHHTGSLFLTRTAETKLSLLLKSLLQHTGVAQAYHVMVIHKTYAKFGNSKGNTSSNLK